MRIGLIADIHGNLTALDAVLAALAAEGVDRLVCLGDVAATGPQPAACVARLRALPGPVATVLGNTDAWLLDPPAARSADPAWRRWEEIDAWCAAQLTPADRVDLATFAPTRAVPLADGGLLVACHGSPRSFDDQLLADTPAGTLDRMLADLPPATAIVAAGHTHAQLLRRHRRVLLVNPGSVGMAVDAWAPTEPDQIRPAPWAEFAVVTADRGGTTVALRRVPIDAGAVAAAALASAMPHAAWWAAEWQPATAATGGSDDASARRPAT